MICEERVVLHCDINHCYAQIEEMKYPALRNIPMAVGGSEEKRHGIILTKNDKAKAYDIKTGESLREAYAKCPQLMIIHPNYEEYIYYTERVKDIYRMYSDKVEAYGLDEAWIDVSESITLFGGGVTIARTIQERVWKELGLTISIGVSFNKIFAKLGSDMIKPSGLVEITKDNYKDITWKLPVEDLFYVGRATKNKLYAYSILTIGDLATLECKWMKEHFGKMGELIWWFANGEDISEVALSTHQEQIKSVGNAITAPRNIESYEEAKLIYYVLVESVASRLRDQGFRGNIIRISLRNTDLVSFTRQQKITQVTNISTEIMEVVLDLLVSNYDFTIPLRSIGVTIAGLEADVPIFQMNLFMSVEERLKQKKLEETVDKIRGKFGFDKARRCAMLLATDLTSFNPKEDHVIHPVSYF